LNGGGGNDSLDGGSDFDTVDYSAATTAVTANLATGAGTGSQIGIDALFNIERVIGGSGNDALTGDSLANVFEGRAGNDTIAGAGGNDTLIGGAGGDRLDGGADTDTVDYSTSSSGVSINLQSGKASGGDAAGDTLISIENVAGSGYADTLVGNSLANVLWGGAGNDTLNGGGAADTLTGGAGQDMFVFKSASEIGTIALHDQITDFEAGGSTAATRVDLIDLSAIDAVAKTTTKNDAFTFIGGNAFTHHAGELRYEQISGSTYIEGDTNGDGVADFYLQLGATGTVDASDFLL
jgi:Ca2+-binding RTX toxin-like protein